MFFRKLFAEKLTRKQQKIPPKLAEQSGSSSIFKLDVGVAGWLLCPKASKKAFGSW